MQGGDLVKAYRSVTVRPTPPAALEPLDRLVRNLRWTWHAPTRALFEQIDPDIWRAVHGDPLRLLSAVSVQRLAELAADADFLRTMADLDADLGAYLTRPGWFGEEIASAPPEPTDGAQPASGDGAPRSIAYFSMEFGISDVLPNFSGGLGVLAGDHLKSASDLAVPLIAVGLFYRYGYFSQALSADGWQQEVYAAHDAHSLIVEPVNDDAGAPLMISVDMPEGRILHARIWLVRVGRVPLLLLDADVDENDDLLRQSTDRLYGGDQDHRIRQEILLGIGGTRAIAAFCQATGFPEPEVFHMNEGHAGFSGLERMSTTMAPGVDGSSGVGFGAALAAVRAGTVFTTHTPVPAGIDRFPMELVRHYLAGDESGRSRLLPGLAVSDVLALGAEQDPARFNMAHLGLRLAQRSNGVARLHGRVSRAMFAGLYPGFDYDEVPIGSVTNGVHLPTWQDPSMRAISEKLAGTRDLAACPDWPNAEAVGLDELWQERCALRARLVALARTTVRESWVHRGRSIAELGWTDSILDPHVLTIGFARRVSTYKRLTLMLQDPARLKALLLDPARPVQIVIAGKAHPADDGGKHLMQQMVQFADDPEIRHRIVVLPNYSMSMAAVLCAGSDIWLNNPIRPQEASGTSGMKAALNGALNLSISDGWWDELYDGQDGWVIPNVEVADDARRDELEAAALYGLIEKRIAPLFYDRTAAGLPEGWTQRVRHALAYLGPRVAATRMVRDYVQQLYVPAAEAARSLAAESGAAAEFANWQQRVRESWQQLRIIGIEVTGIDTAPALGHTMLVRARVDLAGLGADDVTVQVVTGPVDADGHLVDTETTDMTFVGNGDGHRYQAEVALTRAGSLGYTVRVLPRHAALASVAEMGLVREP